STPYPPPTLFPYTTLFRSPAGPDDPLIHLCDRRQSLVYELLQPLPLIRLRRIEIALRVRRDRVHREPLSRLAAAVAELREDRERSEEHTSELQSLRHLVCR